MVVENRQTDFTVNVNGLQHNTRKQDPRSKHIGMTLQMFE